MLLAFSRKQCIQKYNKADILCNHIIISSSTVPQLSRRIFNPLPLVNLLHLLLHILDPFIKEYLSCYLRDNPLLQSEDGIVIKQAAKSQTI